MSEVLDAWEKESQNMISICDNAQINKHPDFVKSIAKVKALAETNRALIDLVRKKDEALSKVIANENLIDGFVVDALALTTDLDSARDR